MCLGVGVALCACVAGYTVSVFVYTLQMYQTESLLLHGTCKQVEHSYLADEQPGSATMTAWNCEPFKITSNCSPSFRVDAVNCGGKQVSKPLPLKVFTRN